MSMIRDNTKSVWISPGEARLLLPFLRDCAALREQPPELAEALDGLAECLDGLLNGFTHLVLRESGDE